MDITAPRGDPSVHCRIILFFCCHLWPTCVRLVSAPPMSCVMNILIFMYIIPAPHLITVICLDLENDEVYGVGSSSAKRVCKACNQPLWILNTPVVFGEFHLDCLRVAVRWCTDTARPENENEDQLCSTAAQNEATELTEPVVETLCQTKVPANVTTTKRRHHHHRGILQKIKACCVFENEYDRLANTRPTKTRANQAARHAASVVGTKPLYIKR